MNKRFGGDHYVANIISAEILLSRKEAANAIGVNEKTLHSYLDIARLFLDRFKRFKSPNGGVCGSEKLTNWDIPYLKKIWLMVQKHGNIQKVAVLMKSNPELFDSIDIGSVEEEFELNKKLKIERRKAS